VAQFNDVEDSDGEADENLNQDNDSEEHITVAALPEQDERNKKKRGKRMNWCNFCGAVQRHLARHLLQNTPKKMMWYKHLCILQIILKGDCYWE
jgi:hypothetical protein